MKQTSEPYKNAEETIAGVPYLWHDYQTNGIVYLDLLFDAHHISEELIPYLGILKVLMGKLNTTEYSYTDFTDEVNLYTGGISNEVNVTGDVQHADNYQVKYEGASESTGSKSDPRRRTDQEHDAFHTVYR